MRFPRFQNISIRSKLILIQVFTCTLILIICCVSFVIIGIQDYKEERAQSLNNLTNLIAENSISSLEFQDPDAAQELLSALGIDSSLVQAFILDATGKAFASFQKADAGTLIYPQKLKKSHSVLIDGKDLYVNQSITHKNKTLGYIQIHGQLTELDNIIYDNIKIAGSLLLLGIIISFLVASIVQGYISHPIQSLASLMQKVTDSGNFKIRAKVQGSDEVNRLAGSFNEMLGQIDRRDMRLSERARELETSVNRLKQAEAALKENENILINSQRIARLGSWTFYHSSNKLIFSEEMFHILGVESQGGPPSVREFLSFLHPDDRHILSRYLRKDPVTEPGVNLEFRVITPKGETRILNANTEIHYNSTGGIVRINGTAQDVTEIKKAEEDLRKAMQVAEESSTAKERFLANMSHEIRTPMNAVIGFSNLLSDTKLNNEQKELLDAVRSSSQSLLHLINDILDYSKIEAGMMRIEETEMRISDVLHSVDLLLKKRATEKGLNLLYNVQSGIPDTLIGDPLRVSQILVNLVSNSIKFTDKGKIEVDIKIKEKRESQIDLEFSVNDTGIGISPDKVASIFDRFTQASSETTRKYGGTGLGLTITKQLIELMGGDIRVESEMGKGSSFIFTIKLRSYAKSSKEIDSSSLPSVPATKDLSKVKILLVEDNKMNQILATKVLNKWHTMPDIAANGRIGTEMFQNQKYDLILMDVQMPEMDGREATSYIRQELKSEIPIIGMSAHAMAGERDKCIGVGMNEYITKPFDPEELYQTIVKYLPTEVKQAS